MKVLMLTNEFPPYTYGGAGRACGVFKPGACPTCFLWKCGVLGISGSIWGIFKVRGFPLGEVPFGAPKPLHSVFGAVQRCWQMNADGLDADLVHCHTWYSHLGGILAKLNYGIPLVITTHSLEPLRPWKREQLAGGYDFSLWVEKTALEMADAIIAVSQGTKDDILKLFQVPEERVHVIHNGIDLHEFKKVESHEGVDAIWDSHRQTLCVVCGAHYPPKGDHLFAGGLAPF